MAFIFEAVYATKAWGIKLSLRSDSFTGYTYDFNIYTGREIERLDGTFGERVVKKLISTATEIYITFCFDRFFTSINLLQNIDSAAVGKIEKIYLKSMIN